MKTEHNFKLNEKQNRIFAEIKSLLDEAEKNGMAYFYDINECALNFANVSGFKESQLVEDAWRKDEGWIEVNEFSRIYVDYDGVSWTLCVR